VKRYTLDPVHARQEVREEQQGGDVTIETYASNPAHFYTDVGGDPRSEHEGFLSAWQGLRFFWDAWGRLVEVQSDQGQALRRHTYDAAGRRVRTEDPVAGETTRYLYWGLRLAAQYVEGTSERQAWGYAGGMDGEAFLVITGSGTSRDGVWHVARDFQGSMLALMDGGGTVVERYRYTAFGSVSVEDGSGGPLAESAYLDRFFLGRPLDPLTGFYDLRYRWYDPATGSFLSPDPLGPVDGWNLYQYGFGTPGTLLLALSHTCRCRRRGMWRSR